MCKTNYECLAKLNEKVIGHTNAKKSLINLINRIKIRAHQKYVLNTPEDELVRLGKLLLIGQSGTGKTLLINEIAKLKNICVVKLDATSIVGAGADGGTNVKDITEIVGKALKDHWEKNYHYYRSKDELKDSLLIFIDEIDKLAVVGCRNENWFKGIQASLLTLLDGDKKDFEGASFVLAGAFTGIQVGKKESSLGFTVKPLSAVNHTNKVDYGQIQDEDLVKHGLITELVGRFTDIVSLDTFSQEDYIQILKDKILPDKLKEHKMLTGQDLFIDEQKLINLATKAYKSNQGIRALKREVDKESLHAEFDSSQIDSVLATKKESFLSIPDDDMDLMNYGMRRY